MNGQDDIARLRIGLSGAVPSREASGDVPTRNTQYIMATVTRLTQRVIAGGGVLLHGAHPTFVPLIEASARSAFRPRDAPDRQVELFVVVPFLTEAQFHEFFVQRRHDDYAVVHPFGNRDGDRTQELERMRDALIASCDVLVCVGGELHVTGGRRPGVLVEVEKARERGVPVLLAGTAGGATRELILNDARSILGANETTRDRQLDGSPGEVRATLDQGAAAATSRIMDEIVRLRRNRRN
jgi:hypothetical protein